MRWLLLLGWFAASVVIAETISGKVIAIADGDTLTVLDVRKRQHKIRLAEIDAPESKQPFGTKSRQSLAEICFGTFATVETKQKDRYGRPIGQVNCDGLHANAEQVRRGMAWVFVRYTERNSSLYTLEENARLARLGLWSDKSPQPPWEWRALQRDDQKLGK